MSMANECLVQSREVLRQQEQATARTELPALDLGPIEDCPRSLTILVKPEQ